ncbi:SusC/RagA family TonB-linked outer membrane protein [Mediterranea massiliensis]|uniref:SusC/RagA family TonB-linked outer membrane protein n=1 Tax=Mediterranea massiliensis TaxID=1841865 RepID=UPI0025A3836A|nr:TonB-dependent receptor [Mediterranea massiliensis]MDM8335906.1 TonB-dependent receptor [Mediterranea massiliensis]
MKKEKEKLFRVLPLAVGLLLVGGNAMAVPVSAPVEYSVNQQTSQVTGVVNDANGDPLIGVNVVEKGNTHNGAITDMDGKFVLNVSPNATLVFSYIGYKPVEVPVNGQRNITVTLHEDSEALDEVVVIGYGAVRKADLAGSVAVMDNKQFKDQPVTRIEDALQGRVSGISVTSSGVPGGDLKIRVRGASSINKSNDPLYVVDGIVRESGLEGINPEDIQSMQILKDASSTAIYGSRGANGVVLVTTKTGKAGQTQVVFDASVGFSNAYHIPEMMGTKEYAQALVDYKGADRDALTGYLDGSNPGIDWMDVLLRTGITQNYKVAISKGNEDTQFYVSGNYLNTKGVITDTDFTRYSVKANVHSKLYKWLELTADVNLSQSNGSGAGFNQSQENPIWVGLNYSPTMEMYNDKGSYNTDPYNNIQNNPYGMLHENQNDRKRNVVSGHVDLKFNILKGLTFTTTNGIDYSDHKGYSFSSTRVQTQNGMGNTNTYNMVLQTTNNLTYMGSWNKHSLTATAVWEATSSETRYMEITGKNLSAEQVGYWDVKNAKTRDASNSYSNWNLLSGVARVMYNYADKYMLTGTFRADGSSRFTNQKWGYFPSIAAAWTVTKEEFMKDIKALSDLKIRASYGIIGNQDIDPYSTLGLMTSTSFNFGTGTTYTGYWANGLATPDLTWEKVKQFDLGIDLGFFKNRLTVSVDYFDKRTSDALLKRTAPNYVGGTSYWVNAGEVSNKGVDLTITGRIIQNDNLQWTSSLNGSYLKNKVTKLTAEEPVIYGASPSPGTVDPATIVKEGEAIGTFYGYKWAGLTKNDKGEFVDSYYTKDGQITTNPSGEDKMVLGCANPDFTLGWNNTITYKNWDFNVFFNAAFGAQRLNLVDFAMNSMVGASMFVTAKDHFDNVGKTMPTPGATNSNYGNSSKWLENADYLRCENISIAYTLPRKVTKFADIRFSLSAQNLFTITGYKGIDPAGASFSANSVDVDNGMDMGAYPNPRTITLGVRMNF